MRPITDMDTVQIEVTNHCSHRCSNCTRLVGHHRSPYFMDMITYRKCVDSMDGFPKMVGIMGGEPLLHPQFKEICEYLGARFRPEQCGLWTCFPPGKSHYREVIAKTFGNIFLNDQSRDDILHCPILVRQDEVPGLERWIKWYITDHCWVQNSWSACVNPHGAFFCEIAGAMSMLLGDASFLRGWPITAGWWKRTPKDYVSQIERYCPLCSASLPLAKRASTEGVDDIGQWWYAKLKRTSPKIKAGHFILNDGTVKPDDRPLATYKDPEYRDVIADRYGMFLMVNERGFQTPYLKRKWKENEDG